jgi:anti-sigma factor RsiW
MSEDRYKGWLGDYVDGTLKEPDRRLLESHLAVCESCRTLADDLLKIKKAASSLPRLSPPESVWKQIESTLRARQPQAPRSYFWTMSSWAMAASVVLLIGALSLMLWWRSGPEEPPADDPAALAGYVASELEQAEKHYGNAISGLEQIIDKESQDEPLDPEVMAVLKGKLFRCSQKQA